MKRLLFIAPVIALAGVALAAPGTQKSHPHKSSAGMSGAVPRPEYQFQTVDEFTQKKLPAKTAASVEGYAVMGGPASDGSVRVWLTDSVDHVLSPKDADGAAASGMSGVIPAASIKKHSTWGWSGKGMQRFVMYSGATHAGKSMHDTVTKMRLTGWAGGKTINPVTRVEVQDDNGNWKTL